jgi:hypothetical protein
VRGEGSYSVGSLRKNKHQSLDWSMIKVSCFYGTQLSRCLPPSPEEGNRFSFRNVVFSSFWSTGRWTRSKTPVILSNMLIWVEACASASPDAESITVFHTRSRKYASDSILLICINLRFRNLLIRVLHLTEFCGLHSLCPRLNTRTRSTARPHGCRSTCYVEHDVRRKQPCVNYNSLNCAFICVHVTIWVVAPCALENSIGRYNQTTVLLITTLVGTSNPTHDFLLT